MSKLDLLLEAERRGILPADKAPLLEEARRRGLVASNKPQEVGSGEATLRNFNDTLTFGLYDPAVAHAKTIASQATGSKQPYWDEYQTNLKREDERTSVARKDIPANIIGRTGGMVAQGVASLPREAAASVVGPVQTATQALIESTPAAARYGAAYGALDAYGHSRGDVGQQIKDIAVGAGEGAVMGPLVNAGLFGVGQGLNAMLTRREARVDANAARMREMREAGVTEPMPLAVTDNALARGTGRFSASQIGGKRIADQATANINDVQGALSRTIGEGLGGREAGDLGQDVQGVLRRQLLDYSLPHDQVPNLPPEQLQAITGAAPAERRMPRPDRVQPVQPHYPPKITPEDYVAQQVAQMPPAQPQYPQPRMPAYPPEPVGPAAPSNDAMIGMNRLSAEKRMLEQKLQTELAPNREAALRPIMSDAFFKTPEFDSQYRPVFEAFARGGPMDPGVSKAAMALRNDPAMAQRMDAYRNYVVREIEFQQNVSRLRDINGQFDPARTQARQSATQNYQDQIQRQRAAAEQEAARLTADERAVAERQAQIATEMNRKVEAERLTPNAEDNVFWANRRAEQEAERAAAAETARLQAEAEQRNAARVETLRAGDRPFQSGASRESYKTEFEAGYGQAFRDAPQVQFNPLGSKNDTPTRTGRLLTEIGLEARQGSRLPGFDGNPFDANGAIKPDMMQLVRSMAGPDIAQRLAVLSEKRAKGQFAPNIEGMHDLRSAIGRTISAAKARQRQGQPMDVDEAFLARLYGSLSSDMQTALRLSGPEGARAATRIGELDRAYRQHLDETVRPLKRIFGDQVGPVEALDRITKAARTGDTRTLGAFMRVMSQKDDPIRGTNAVLWHMTNGGRDLRTFIKTYREMPTPTRNMLFAGERGRALEAQLDRYVAASQRLEQFINVANQRNVVDPTRLTHVMTIAGAIMHWPTVLGAVAGNAVAARMMTSPRYLRWLTEMPNASRGGFETEAFRRHLAIMGAIAGGDKDIGDRFFAGVQKMVGVSPAHALFAGENAKTANKEALALAKSMQNDGKSRDEIRNATGWWFEDGRWNFETGSNARSIQGSDEMQSGKPFKMGDAMLNEDAYAAYPDLENQTIARGNLRNAVGVVQRPAGGFPQMTISNTPEMLDYFGSDGARLLALSHETQHQVDHEEDGRNTRRASADSKQPYYAQRGERRAYNAAYRDVTMTPDQKRRVPPWVTEEDAVRSSRSVTKRSSSPLR